MCLKREPNEVHLNLIENWPLDGNQFPIAELLSKAQNFFPRTILGRETLCNKNLPFQFIEHRRKLN